MDPSACIQKIDPIMIMSPTGITPSTGTGMNSINHDVLKLD